MTVLNFCEKCAISMILSVSILNAAATTFDKPTENQMHLLHNTVKALLDFKTDPTVSNEQRKSYARSNDAVAKYMKELFKRYKTFGDDISMGTTVRSIAPKIDVINGREALVFSLQSLKPNEEIIRAEIHYNLGKPSKSFVWKQKKSKEIRCIRLRPSSTPGSSADLELPQATDHSEEIFDWIAFDAQTSVIATLDDKSSAFSSPPSNNGSSVPHALGIAFATKNHHDGKYKRLSAKKSIRHHSPFLLIFTDEPSPPEDTQERVLSAVGVVDEASNEEDSSSEEDENATVNRAKRHVTSVRKDGDADASKYYHYSVDDREAQQVQDADRSATNRVKAFQSQGPTVLQETKQLRRHRKIKPRKYNNGLLPTPRKYQPFGAESTVDNGRRSNGEKEKNRKRTTQTPLQFRSVDVGTNQKQLLVTAKHQQQRWTGGQATHENDATLVLLETEQPEVCQKRDLVVEFSDIGWGEWIIAPKSFEAHYCSGACPFPLPPNSNPSNHAVIQSIIHAVGLHPAVPQVCCSPEKMDSLTLLYFDEEQNVVLKNYPKMTVSSCGCL